MTPNTNLERRLNDYYASEPSLRAPDRVLLTALATIDTTHQRRGLLAPWRFLTMNNSAKVAVAAVAALVVGALAFSRLSIPGPGDGQTPAPIASPTPRVAPTLKVYVPPPLTETFTSERHGLSMSYPEGWTAEPATTSWTMLGFLEFGSAQVDLLQDPARGDGHLFIAAASQPLGDRSFAEWSAELLAALEADDPACTEMEPIVVDGSDGLIGTECAYVIVAEGGRGYFLIFYASHDDSDLAAFDLLAWAKEVLTTVQLQPQQAVDAG